MAKVRSDRAGLWSRRRSALDRRTMVGLLALGPFSAMARAQAPGDPAAILAEVIHLAEAHHLLFGKPREGLTAARRDAWDEAKATARATVGRMTDGMGDAALVATANALLGSLGTSHTQLFSAEEQAFWAYRGIFGRSLDEPAMPHIGAWFMREGGRWRVTEVYEGSAAERAGLRRGDEMISADGGPFTPVRAFAGRAAATLTWRSGADEPPRYALVPVASDGVQRMMLRAMAGSGHIIARGCARIAYVALPAGTHPVFLDVLTTAARRFATTSSAMVLDLRGGFGGADPAYAAPFIGPDAIYRKPMAVLIDAGTRSGKEWLAFLFKESSRAPLIGTRTAGAFLPGKTFAIGSRHLLMLAVADVGSSGIELEGRGVLPDIAIDWPLGARGEDPQFETAVDRLAMTSC